MLLEARICKRVIGEHKLCQQLKKQLCQGSNMYTVQSAHYGWTEEKAGTLLPGLVRRAEEHNKQNGIGKTFFHFTSQQAVQAGTNFSSGQTGELSRVSVLLVWAGSLALIFVSVQVWISLCIIAYL